MTLTPELSAVALAALAAVQAVMLAWMRLSHRAKTARDVATQRERDRLLDEMRAHTATLSAQVQVVNAVNADLQKAMLERDRVEIARADREREREAEHQAEVQRLLARIGELERELAELRTELAAARGDAPAA